MLIVLHVGLLCCALLFVYRKARGGESARVSLMLGVPLAVFTGVGLTDQMLLVCGLAPFVLAPLLCCLRLRSRAWQTVNLFALLTGVLAVVVELAAVHAMHDRHVVSTPYPITFVSSEALVATAQNMISAR